MRNYDVLTEAIPAKHRWRIDECAAFFAVSPKTIRNWCASGLLTAEKYKRVVRITRESIVALCESSRQNFSA